ncbi:MAG: hypothetical protein HN337_08290 [Deltaproteobacteria bacterium]|jgi:hypothetical protein|nr:hypothetical protein [Deltaproteobacteria bacterium]
MGEKNRTSIEKVVLLILFLGMLALVTVTFMKERTVTKQKSLYHELAILRQGVGTFQIIEKRHPKSLIELAMATYEIPGENARYKYVQMVEIGDNSTVIDPFGNAYKYNPTNGWVKSTTPGYTDW